MQKLPKRRVEPIKSAPSDKLILVWLISASYWVPAMLEMDADGGERHLRVFAGSKNPSSIDILYESDASHWLPMLRHPVEMMAKYR